MYPFPFLFCFVIVLHIVDIQHNITSLAFKASLYFLVIEEKVQLMSYDLYQEQLLVGQHVTHITNSTWEMSNWVWILNIYKHLVNESEDFF